MRWCSPICALLILSTAGLSPFSSIAGAIDAVSSSNLSSAGDVQVNLRAARRLKQPESSASLMKPFTYKVNMADFPSAPPLKLSDATSEDGFTGRKLGGGMLTNETTGLRSKGVFLSFPAKIGVANSNGKNLYAAKSSMFSIHSHTRFYDAQTGQRLAMIRRPSIFFTHWVFDLLSYEPVCPSQKPDSEQDDGVPLYKYARITKWFWTLRNYWKLQRYECDGTLSDFWEIQARHLLQHKQHYDIREQDGPTIGTIDQPWWFQATNTYDAWIAKGADLSLFAATLILMDFAKPQPQNHDSGSSGGSNVGGGGGGAGNAAR